MFTQLKHAFLKRYLPRRESNNTPNSQTRVFCNFNLEGCDQIQKTQNPMTNVPKRDNNRRAMKSFVVLTKKRKVINDCLKNYSNNWLNHSLLIRPCDPITKIKILEQKILFKRSRSGYSVLSAVEEANEDICNSYCKF